MSFSHTLCVIETSLVFISISVSVDSVISRVTSSRITVTPSLSSLVVLSASDSVDCSSASVRVVSSVSLAFVTSVIVEGSLSEIVTSSANAVAEQIKIVLTFLSGVWLNKEKTAGRMSAVTYDMYESMCRNHILPYFIRLKMFC